MRTGTSQQVRTCYPDELGWVNRYVRVTPMNWDEATGMNVFPPWTGTWIQVRTCSPDELGRGNRYIRVPLMNWDGSTGTYMSSGTRLQVHVRTCSPDELGRVNRYMYVRVTKRLQVHVRTCYQEATGTCTYVFPRWSQGIAVRWQGRSSAESHSRYGTAYRLQPGPLGSHRKSGDLHRPLVQTLCVCVCTYICVCVCVCT